MRRVALDGGSEEPASGTVSPPFLPHLTLSASALACVLSGLPVDNEEMSPNQQVFCPQRTASPVSQTIWGLFLSAANGSISLVSEANILAGHVYCLDSDSF